MPSKKHKKSINVYHKIAFYTLAILAALQLLVLILIWVLPAAMLALGNMSAQAITIIGLVHTAILALLSWGVYIKSKAGYIFTLVYMIPTVLVGGYLGIFFAAIIVFSLVMSRKEFF